MKKVIFGTLFLGLVGLGIVGCKKESVVKSQSEDNNIVLKSSVVEDYFGDGSDIIQARPTVVYGTFTCELANGESGTECIITQTDDDCSLQTDCKAALALPNYKEVLHKMFTPGEIQERAGNKVRIIEPELIEALKKDGFPLK